jgi:hypothetical protein
MIRFTFRDIHLPVFWVPRLCNHLAILDASHFGLGLAAAFGGYRNLARDPELGWRQI